MESPIKLKEAAKLLNGKFSADALRKKIWINEISGIRFMEGKKEVLGISQETLNLLMSKGNGEDQNLYSKMKQEWKDAQRYGTHGRKPKPLSERTIKEYAGYLEQYFTSVNKSASIENLSPDNFEQCMWSFKPTEEELAKGQDYFSTKQKIYNAVTSFYLHLIKRGYKSEAELLKIRKQKPSKGSPEKRRVLTNEQWQRFYQANKFLKGRTVEDQILSEVIILLFGTAGLRRGEVIRLQLDWINFETGKMDVLGKNNKWRIVYANTLLLNAFKKWLPYRPKSKHLNLLLKEDGTPITPRMIATRIDTIRKRAKVDISPHGLRHTFATLGMEQGAELIDMQEVLGHDHVSTTMRYVHANQNKAAKNIQKLNFGIDASGEVIVEPPKEEPKKRKRISNYE